MNPPEDTETPLVIPNLTDLRNALKSHLDSYQLLEAFNGTEDQISPNLTEITDKWLTEANGEEDAA